MGKLAVVVHDNEEFTLSLVSWGFLRRMAQGKDARNVMGVSFTPHYELGVWRGSPTTRNMMRVPELLVYFQNRGVADRALDEIGIAVRNGGLGQPLRDLFKEWQAYPLFLDNVHIAPFGGVAQ